MAFWFSKKSSIDDFHEVTLPGDVGTVSIPSSFTTEMSGNDMLLAYPDTDAITLRFSSISFVNEKGENEYAAKEHVRKNAIEKGYEYSEQGANGVASYEESADEDGVRLVIKYWNVGAKNTVVILSATIDEDQRTSKAVRRTLKAIPAILDSLSITKSHKVIVAEDKRIELTEETVGDAPQDVQQFGQNELAWLGENTDFARQLSLKYGSGGELDPEELDRIFARWVDTGGSTESPDSISNALGAAFGSYLVEQHEFEWVVVNDEFGMEYAVRHQLGNTMSFPRDAVIKRIEKGETTFFDSLHLVIVDHLKQIQSENE